MRLLFVIHYPVFGGPHNQAATLSEPLRERGWETTVALPCEDGNAKHRLEGSGVRVIQMRLSRARATRNPARVLRWMSNLPSDVFRLRRIMSDRAFDVVMFCGPINLQPAVAARWLGLPVVCQLVDTRTPPFLRRCAMPLIRHYSDVLLCTGMTVAKMHPGALELGDRLVTYFPPVDSSSFMPSQRTRARSRTELGISDWACVIGNVANLNPQKDHLTFVRAAAVLRRSLPNAVFLLLGAEHSNHSAYSNRIRELARQLGLSVGRDLLMVDPRDRVHQLAQAMDVFWLTSEPMSEGLPTAIGEAMALGIPVVATDVGGVREIVSDGDTGLIVPPRDPVAIAKATTRIVSDPIQLQRMGRRSIEVAMKLFDSEICADAHVRAFNAAIKHSRRA